MGRTDPHMLILLRKSGSGLASSGKVQADHVLNLAFLQHPIPWGQSKSTAGRTFALKAADLGLIPLI